VQFSVLVANMRTILTEQIGKPEGRTRPLAQLALSSLTAQPMAEAFFSICRAVTTLDTAEREIEKRLRKEVIDETTRRNDIAHGDWLIAQWARPTIEPAPVLVRVKAGRLADPFAADEYTIERIDEICAEVERIAQAVWEFGTVCTELGAYDPSRGRASTRLRDALKIDESGHVAFRSAEPDERIEKHRD
jgi:hypothetical protein